MKLPHRRQFLHLAAGAAALPAVSRVAWAQAYPTRPVRIIVPVPPGGGIDIVARLIGQWLSERLGQPFVIENRPGAATNIGTESVVRAPADGYTLLLVTPANVINATLYDKLNFNFIRDIAPVAGIIRVANVMTLHPSVPARTVPEFIRLSKQEQYSFASSGNGGAPHMAGELFKSLTGAQMLHVSLAIHEVPDTTTLDTALVTLKKDRPDALMVPADAFLVSQRSRIAQFAIEKKLPSVFSFREYIEAGGLMAYTPNYNDLFRRAASYVDKILKGAKPGELPIEQPTKFHLLINLKTARTLGVTLPPWLLVRADEVIE